MLRIHHVVAALRRFMSISFTQRLLPVVCVLLTSACDMFCDSGCGTIVPSLQDFQVQPAAVTMAVGDTVQVHAIPTDSDGEVYDTVSDGGWSGIYWHSTVREVATVVGLDTMPGNPIKVTAVSPGQTDICPNALGVSGDCADVTVEARPSLK
jgi:hypothetical protein